MKIITNKIDRILLLQTLFYHGKQKGLGKLVKDPEMTENDAIDLLNGKEEDKVSGLLIDYYDGVPMKIEFCKDKSGDEFIDTSDYDYAHGEYRFLEAMLNSFDLSEIVISKRVYDSEMKTYIREKPNQHKEEIEELLKAMIKRQEPGIYCNEKFRFPEEIKFVPFRLRELL